MRYLSSFYHQTENILSGFCMTLSVLLRTNDEKTIHITFRRGGGGGGGEGEETSLCCTKQGYLVLDKIVVFGNY